MSTTTDDVWQEILKNLEIPSSRMLLSQQAKIAIVDEKEIVILVAKNWFGMIQKRSDLIQQCVDRVLPGKTVILKPND
tara:strand:+ start:557 stop:790 length:234 start_codon:yes stop_codon:yes gene_type:complete